MRNRRNITVCFFIAVCIFLRVVCETVRLGFKPEFGLKTHNEIIEAIIVGSGEKR